MDKDIEILKKIIEIKESQLNVFFDAKKFIHSELAHQVALSSAKHFKEYKDCTYINQFLSFFKFGSTYYLKAVRWFEYRSGISLSITNGKVKKHPQSIITGQTSLKFSEFLAKYKGTLPIFNEQNRSSQSADILEIQPDLKRLLAIILAFKNAKLYEFFLFSKFVQSKLCHQIAEQVAEHFRNHRDTIYISQILSLYPFGNPTYLKVVRWFEYTSGISLLIIDEQVKKNPENLIQKQEHHQFGEFISKYSGELPTIQTTKKKKTANKKNSPKKKSKILRDSLDLIDSHTPMYIGKHRVYGGYGTGKRK